MRRALTTSLLSVCVLLAGCGEEPAIRSYESAMPAAYDWPTTETREAEHDADGLPWVWEVPAGWVDAPEVPDQLVADYRFKGVNEALPGRLTISMIPGEAGGVMANVQRWRKQLFVTNSSGMGPRDVVSRPMPGQAGMITIVELAGQYQGPNTPTHLLGAIVQVGALEEEVLQSWFFKMVGDRETIEANRLAFAELFLSFRPKGMERLDLSGELPGPEPPEEERPFLARPLDQLDDDEKDEAGPSEGGGE